LTALGAWHNRPPVTTRRPPNLVIAIYVVFGGWAVHGLRYALVPTAPRGTHGYLQAAPPILAGLLALALARLCVALVDRRATGGRALAWHARWALGAVGFAALYGAQETIELTAVSGHLAGPTTLIAHGGWIVVPLVIVAAGLFAALLRGTEAALEHLTDALPHPRLRPRAPARASIATVRPLRRPRAAALARHAAGRAPPFPA
jgi:hypothetical protein